VVRTHVALLRGINVGGRNKVAMADLREIVTSLGHTDVATYIQSGNVVFTSPETDTARLAEDLEQAIAERLGVQPGVVVVSGEELRQVIGSNPYPDEASPRYLHAVFRRQEMDRDGCSSAPLMASVAVSWPRSSPGPAPPWRPGQRATGPP
jgi:uncharacterized protein (DUF1697 family)